MLVNIRGGGRVDSYHSFWVEKGVESKVFFPTNYNTSVIHPKL